MAAPHYVARKVGDQYVMVRTDTPLGCAEPGWFAAGSLLLTCGLLRRGFLGCLTIVAGGGLFYRGMTGKNPLVAVLGLIHERKFDSGPTFQNQIKPVDQTPQDTIDEASMESFPASDPPARMTPAPPAPVA